MIWAVKAFRRVIVFLRGLFGGQGQDQLFHSEHRQELPDAPIAGVLYVLGENGHLWSAALLCPCGCGDTIEVSLHQEGRPRWRLTEYGDGKVSLSPSIWRTTGCRSHFILDRGLIQWCQPE